MTLQRRRVHWTGFQGGPGVNTFFLQEGATANAALRTFYAAFSTSIPSSVSISFDVSGDEIDEATGALTGSWTDSAAAAVNGSGAGAVAGPAGAVAEWLTADVAAHRRIVGKTFLVPLATTAYESNGTLTATVLSALQGAAAALASTLVTPNQLKVWHRPVGGAGGRAVDVIGSRVPDLVAVLRSRRD